MFRSGEFDQIPVVDIAPFGHNDAETAQVANVLRRACRESGFFYVVGHGVDPALIARLEIQLRDFPVLPIDRHFLQQIG